MMKKRTKNIMKNKLGKKALLFFTALLVAFSLAGCDDIQIFKEKVDPNALVPVKDKDLKNEAFYVKQNTRFFKTYNSEKGSATQEVSALDESRVFMTMQDDTLIPTHYSDELVAFKSDELKLTSITLERFKDLGYSVGAFNGEVTNDGYLYFERQQKVVPDSSFYNAIGETISNDIRIASIDGIPLSPEQINTKAGVIVGLEKNKTYNFGFYVGTVYYEKQVEADCHTYEAYEMFSYGEDYISDTPNGYMCFNTPKELKCGYYNINGDGLFKYYNFIRGSQDEDEVDMNISYYADERSKIEAYSRQYNVSVPKRVKDLKIIVKLNSIETKYEGDLIQGIVFTPDNEKLDMEFDENERTLTIAMAEGMAGDWTVNVIPKTLDVENVEVENDEAAEEATCEEQQIVLPEDRENVEFIAEYTSFKEDIRELTVFGTILTEDGKTYEMETSIDETDHDNPRYFISYELPFAAAGNYTVRIYHYPEETTIMIPEVKDKTETETEIIVIDG